MGMPRAGRPRRSTGTTPCLRCCRRGRNNPDECREKAEGAHSPLDKEGWLRLAGNWIVMAQEADKREPRPGCAEGLAGLIEALRRAAGGDAAARQRIETAALFPLIHVARNAGAAADRADRDVAEIDVPAIGAVRIFTAGEGGHSPIIPPIGPGGEAAMDGGRPGAPRYNGRRTGYAVWPRRLQAEGGGEGECSRLPTRRIFLARPRRLRRGQNPTASPAVGETHQGECAKGAAAADRQRCTSPPWRYWFSFALRSPCQRAKPHRAAAPRRSPAAGPAPIRLEV